MKPFKLFLTLFFSLNLLLTFSGCSISDSNDESKKVYNDAYFGDYPEEVPILTTDLNLSNKNIDISIYNINNQKIDCISCYSYLVFADNSIIYTKVPANASSDSTLEFRLYDIETKKDYKLTTVDNYTYTATHEAIEYNNHLYLSVSTNGYAEPSSILTIYDIDLSGHTMRPILEVEGAIPYNSYTIADNKLILAELLYNGDTDLIEVDLSKEDAFPVAHKYDESDCFVPDSIRSIFADEEKIYTIRLDWDEYENYSLYLDTYDFQYNLLNTIDIMDFCTPIEYKQTKEDMMEEWQQFVAHFFIHDDFIYYHNFSMTRAIGKVEGDKINRLFDTNGLFNYAETASDDITDYLFYQSYANKPSRNTFYRVNPQTFAIESAQFFADNIDYAFHGASRDGDKILLTMGNIRYDSNDVKLPDRLYYIDINDLEFKTLE